MLREKDDKLYKRITNNLAEAIVEADQTDTTERGQATHIVKQIKTELSSLKEDIDTQAELTREIQKQKDLNQTAPEVKPILDIIQKTLALIPEILSLEKKLGTG